MAFFLGGIGAGITEEMLFWFFLLPVFFWLGGWIVRSQKPHSKEIVFWIANVLSALFLACTIFLLPGLMIL